MDVEMFLRIDILYPLINISKRLVYCSFNMFGRKLTFLSDIQYFTFFFVKF